MISHTHQGASDSFWISGALIVGSFDVSAGMAAPVAGMTTNVGGLARR